MSTPSRLQVALPAIVTFAFGLTFGLVAGRILWKGAQPAQQGGMAAMPGGGGMGQPPAAQDGGEGMDGGPSDADMRRMLAAHEQLLEKSPEDVALTRTVGNYHSLLGQNEQALDLYAKARELAGKAGDEAQILEIMIDEAIARVETGDIAAGLKQLEEVSAKDTKDVRSRLTRVAVYLERVIPQPPPGMDRKQAVASAEAVLDEIEALEPTNEYAIQFRRTIDSIRQMMGRPRETGPAAAGSAPATAAPPAP